MAEPNLAQDSVMNQDIRPDVAPVKQVASMARPVVTSDIAPDVEIVMEGVCACVSLPASAASAAAAAAPAAAGDAMPSVWRAFGNMITAPVRIPARMISQRLGGAKDAAPRRVELRVLDNVSGVIRPGTLTLVLAPPGHGKSAYLKSLAQLLPGAKGKITYSGLTPEEAKASGVHLGQLVQYVSQLDEHLPFLTVRETLEFVHANACLDPAQFGHQDLAGAHEAAVDDIMTLLHLRNCANTVIGNELLRGVSGGEKKRVTVGEGLLTNARVLALDEISTGLDSAVTYDIVARLKQRAVDGNMAVVIALLQPTPEVYGLFDEILLLREGAVVYHGPRRALPGYLADLGYQPPAEDAAQGKGQADLADWITSMLTNPSATLAAGPGAIPSGSTTDLRSFASRSQLVGAEDTSPSAAAGAPAAVEPESTATNTPVPTTTEALVAAWRSSDLFRQQMNNKGQTKPLALTTPFARAQYGHSYVHSAFQHIWLLLWRQFIVMRRNLLYIRSRLASALLMSIILGGLYYQRSAAQGLTLMGTFLNSQMLMSFNNFSEMATAVEFKYIAYKHVANGQHPAFAFPLAAVLAHAPVALVETLIFTGILFGMSGMTNSAHNYFVYWFAVFCVDIFMGAFMRVFAYRGRTLQAAQTLPLPLISALIVFAGFLVTVDNMPRWLFWLNYVDIYGWGLRSLAQNEFLSDKYSARPAGPTGPTLGEAFLRTIGYPVEVEWMWGGLLFMAAAALGTVLLSIWAFSSVRFDRNIGSSRSTQSTQASTVASNGSTTANRVSVMTPQLQPAPAAVPAATDAVSVPVATASAALPFEPMQVTFQDIRYTVKLPKHMGGGHKTLLHGITGAAQPGRMLALMGASGAGKTTLLDVLASRKNSGKMEGRITLNGFDKDPRTFNRIAAYVEQQDIHVALTTVREALEFSALLRLPESVTEAQRKVFIDEIVRLLELGELQHRKVGRPGEPDGLAPAERKHLTIGVELVSNAPVIFLDEPTSGLDSRAAANVMRTIRRVADSGRTIICTVHQPAADLFYQFDDLLLLQRGGYQAYFGPLGRHGADLVRYLEAVPSVAPCPRNVNVSSWMLETLALPAPADKAVSSPVPDAAPAGSHAGDIGSPSPPVKPMPSTHPLSGPALHEAYFASSTWVLACKPAVEKAAQPAQGASPVSFSSLHSRNWFVQVYALFNRFWASYNRNVPLNVGRTVALLFLNLIFGIVWYKIADAANSQSGVQSLTAVIFMTLSFAAMVNMNVAIPQIFGIRAAFYREQASRMYDPSAFSLSLICTELPWLAFSIIVSTPVAYFMIGLSGNAGTFFYHCLVQYVLASVYVSMGQALAAAVPTFEVAQAVLGFFQPILFLFGGLFSPVSQMVIGARWFCYIDQILYAFRAIMPVHFYCSGSGCPAMQVVTPGGFVTRDRYDYTSNLYEFDYFARWENLGYLALFFVAYQSLSWLAVRYVRHIVR